MATYCANSDLVLDNGQEIDEYMLETLSEAEKTTRKNAARTKAYNRINDGHLRGRTAIPATHISGLKEVEIYFVIADMLSAAFTQGVANVSEWSEAYETRAKDMIDNIRFDSSAEAPSADSENTGDGTITVTTNDSFTLTEKWIIRAGSNPDQFRAHGSIHGYLPNYIEVGTKYPEKEVTWALGGDYGLGVPSMRFEEYPITVLITAGSTDFVKDDKFIFNTYSASYLVSSVGNIIRG